MQLQIIKNQNPEMGDAYKIARVIYAETLASSLHGVEALCSMIANRAVALNETVPAVANDSDLFDVLRTSSPRHQYLYVPATNRGFQMCLRVVQRMMRGNLPDACHGAVRFHHDNQMPFWAVSRGYIADIDGMLFYM